MYTLDIDSSERDTNTYPNPNDYIVKLNTPLFNVNNIKLRSARIPNSQLLINQGNKQFDIGTGNTVVLTEGTWSNGLEFSSNLTDSLTNFSGSDDIVVTFDQNTNSLTFTSTVYFSFDFYGGSNGYVSSSDVGTPSSVLGFTNSNTTPATTLVSNVIDLDGPSSIIMRLTNGADDFEQTVFINGGEFSFDSYTSDAPSATPLNTSFMGRILTTGGLGSITNFTNTDDSVEHRFYKGPEKSIDELRVRFYYNNGTKLIPYDFGSRNHLLKFEIDCSIEKLSSLIYEDPPELPPPVTNSSYTKLTNNKRLIWIIISISLVVGLLTLLMFNE